MGLLIVGLQFPNLRVKIKWGPFFFFFFQCGGQNFRKHVKLYMCLLICFQIKIRMLLFVFVIFVILSVFAFVFLLHVSPLPELPPFVWIKSLSDMTRCNFATYVCINYPARCFYFIILFLMFFFCNHCLCLNKPALAVPFHLQTFVWLNQAKNALI